MFQSCVNLFLAGSDLCEEGLVLMLVQVLVQGFADRGLILIEQSPELLQLMATELEGTGVTTLKGHSTVRNSLSSCMVTTAVS
jgi:hypothetical protein